MHKLELVMIKALVFHQIHTTNPTIQDVEDDCPQQAVVPKNFLPILEPKLKASCYNIKCLCFHIEQRKNKGFFWPSNYYF